jgi:hypothetical protein
MGRRLLLLSVLVLLAVVACRDEEPLPETGLGTAAPDSLVPDSLVWGEDRARDTTPAGDADRRFLEHLLDHYQGLEHLAERIRLTSTVSAARRDTWRFDRRHDDERREAETLLRELYNERYIPRVPEEFREAAVAIPALPREQQARALLELVTRHNQEDGARIDQVLPRLRHPQVRSLVQELRTDQQRDLRVLASRLAKE